MGDFTLDWVSAAPNEFGNPAVFAYGFRPSSLSLRGLGTAEYTDPITGDTWECPVAVDPNTGGCYDPSNPASMPCLPSGYSGPLQQGQTYCPAVPGAPVIKPPTQGFSIGGVTLSPAMMLLGGVVLVMMISGGGGRR